MTGTSTATSHAPWVNLVTAMTTSTAADRNAPAPLIIRPRRHAGSRSRKWCRAMPAWERVNDVKTPSA
jgi:hypothetical protein